MFNPFKKKPQIKKSKQLRVLTLSDYSNLTNQKFKSISKIVESEKNNLVNKKTEQKTLEFRKSKINTKIKQLPNWWVFQGLYETQSFVTSAVNRTANIISGLNHEILINGYHNQELLDIIETIGGDLTDTYRKMSINLIVTGVAIDNKFALINEDVPFAFRIIPTYETNAYHIDPNALEANQIKRFSWYANDIINYLSIDIEDKNGDRNFYISRFGGNQAFLPLSPLQSVVSQLDGMNFDDHEYKKRLENFGFTPIIAMVNETQTVGDTGGLANQVESLLRSMRDPENRYKIPVISGEDAIDPETGTPQIVFKEFSPAEINPRLGTQERQEINRQVANILGVPPVMEGLNKGGLGNATEWQMAMITYNQQSIEPITKIIDKNLNNYRIPHILEYLEKEGWFKEKYEKGELYKEVNGVRVPVKATDCKIRTSLLNTWLPEQKAKLGMEAVQYFDKGVFTSKEIKTRFLGYSDEEVNEKDDIDERLANPETANVQETEVENKDVDSVLEDIDNLEEKKIELEKSKQNYLEKNKKAKAKKKSKEINKIDIELKQKYVKYSKTKRFSRIPGILKMVSSKNIKKQAIKAYKKQYLDIELEPILENLKKDGLMKSKNPVITNKVKNQVKVKNLQEFLDVDLLINEIFSIALVGMNEAIGDAENAGFNLKDSDRLILRKEITDSIYDFVFNQLEGGVAEPNRPTNLRINEFKYTGSVNDTSTIRITDIISKVVSENLEASETELIKQIKNKFKEDIDLRSSRFSEANSVYAYTLGKWKVQSFDDVDPVMRWLMTYSTNPRVEHLSLVGNERRASEFPNFPGELPDCKCSWVRNYVPTGGFDNRGPGTANLPKGFDLVRALQEPGQIENELGVTRELPD